MSCEIVEVILNPDQRKKHTEHLFRLDGLKDVVEKPDACYCALPLSDVPVGTRDDLIKTDNIIRKAIEDAGLDVWDPIEGANPWYTLEHDPQEVYDMDSKNVMCSRFFCFINIGPATGAGIEQQKAIMLNKISVIITKAGIYTTRMSTGARRCIILEYNDLEKQKGQITEVFRLLTQYEPGIGTCSIHGNALLGFSDSSVVCLKGLIEEKFPELQYNFDQYRKSK